jgi:hypothetical protein
MTAGEFIDWLDDLGSKMTSEQWVKTGTQAAVSRDVYRVRKALEAAVGRTRGVYCGNGLWRDIEAAILGAPPFVKPEERLSDIERRLQNLEEKCL